MAVTLIAKNQTAGALALTQLSVPNNEVPAGVGSTVTLTDFATVNEIQDDVELIAHITAGDVIINDGTTDLTQVESLAIVQTTAGPTPGGIPEDLAITSLSASSFVSASVYYGDGSNLTGVSSNPAGSNTEIQFNADGAFGADPQFTWASGSNILTVTGDISGSGAISGSFFYGDGGSLTNLPSAAISTYNTPGADRIITSVNATTVEGEANLTFDNTTLTITGDISGSGNISGSSFYGDGSNLTDLNASNISAGTLNNARLPATISVTNVTASTLVSASAFYGDGSNLTGIISEAAGSDTEIQFNDGGTAFGGDPQFTWNKTSNTLTVTGDVSASVNISGSDFYGGGANLTDLNASNISAGTLNNARLPATISVTNVTASTLVSASAFYGDGSNLTNLPAGNAAGSDTQIQFNDGTAFGGDAEFTWNKTTDTLTVTGDISASVNISGSDFYGGGANLTDLNASNISAGTLNNARLPATISVTNVTASTLVSASSFYGDGANLTGIAAGSDTQVQFRDAGGFAADPQFTWDKTNNILTLGGVSGSGNISGSDFYGGGANLTDLNASNISAGTLANARLPTTISVTNVTASSLISASFLYGDGSNLTGIEVPLLVGNSLFVDGINGNDGTGTRGDKSQPYLTISSAIAASIAGDAIYVTPGDYPETSLAIPAGRALFSQGGYAQTSIGITSSATDIITTVDDTWIEGFTVHVPTGSSNAGIRYTGGTGGTMQAYSMAFSGDGASGQGDGFVKTGTGKVIGSEIRLVKGGLSSIIRVDQGVMAFESIHVPSASGDITNIALAEGTGRAQLINFNAGNSNVVNAMTVSGSATAICLSVNWVDIQNGLNIQQDGVNVEINGGKIQHSAYAVTMNNSETFTSASIISLTNINSHPDFNFPPSALNAQFEVKFTTTADLDHYAAESLFGTNLEIGFPEKGSAIAVGKGSSYAFGIKVYTSDGTDTTTTTGSLIDVTTSASSIVGSPFTFQGGSPDHCIYFGSTRKDVDSNPLKYCGINVDTSVGSLTGAYVYEIWNGSAWSDIDYQCTSVDTGYRYANNPFMRTDSEEFIRFGLDDDTAWAISTIGGDAAYWTRCRIVTSASLPQFEKWWVTPTHLSISEAGVRQSHGGAIWQVELGASGNVFGESGGVVGANILVGSGGLPTEWTQRMPNSNLNGSGDAIYTQFTLPPGINTSLPLKFKIIYSLDSAAAAVTFPTGILSVIPIQVTGVNVADPLGGKIPTPRTFANTETLTAKAAPLALSKLLQPTGAIVGDDLSNRIISTIFSPLSIEEYYEDDIVAIRFELDNHGSPNYNVSVWAIMIEGHKFTEGKPR